MGQCMRPVHGHQNPLALYDEPTDTPPICCMSDNTRRQVSSQVVFLACMQAGSSQALICKTCVQLLSSIYSNKVTSYMNGHDHAMAVGNPQQDNVQQA